MTAINVSYQEVLAAARELAASADGMWHSYEIYASVAGKLGLSRNDARTSLEHRAVQKFDGQVLRAFNLLVTEAVLVKVGKGETSPSGHVLGNQAQFWTPKAFEAAKERHKAAEAAAAAITARWERVAATLRSQDFEVAAQHPARWGSPDPSLGTTGISFSLDAWERLLGIAGDQP